MAGFYHFIVESLQCFLSLPVQSESLQRAYNNTHHIHTQRISQSNRKQSTNFTNVKNELLVFTAGQLVTNCPAYVCHFPENVAGLYDMTQLEQRINTLSHIQAMVLHIFSK